MAKKQKLEAMYQPTVKELASVAKKSKIEVASLMEFVGKFSIIIIV